MPARIAGSSTVSEFARAQPLNVLILVRVLVEIAPISRNSLVDGHYRSLANLVAKSAVFVPFWNSPFYDA